MAHDTASTVPVRAGRGNACFASHCSQRSDNVQAAVTARVCALVAPHKQLAATGRTERRLLASKHNTQNQATPKEFRAMIATKRETNLLRVTGRNTPRQHFYNARISLRTRTIPPQHHTLHTAVAPNTTQACLGVLLI